MKAIVVGASRTATGKLFKLKSATSIHTLQVVFTGSISALSVNFQGSIDGVNVFTLLSYSLSASEIAAKAAMIHVVNKLVEYIEVDIVTLTGTGSVTISHSPANDEALQVN